HRVNPVQQGNVLVAGRHYYGFSSGVVDPPLREENEEQIRRHARRRLEEQLKQYRVERHQERSKQSTPKHRPTSTLDPELMFHPEILPRASTLALTKEYSFMRTSVPRGPKVGSLGVLTTSRAIKNSKSSKIRSLADYKTEVSEPGSGAGGTSSVESSSGTLQQNRTGSSTSVISQMGFTLDNKDRLETLSNVEDSSSEVDGSEAGSRQDDSEAEGYEITSGPPVSLLSVDSRLKAVYTVDGREISAEALGQFPSIGEVLKAAAEEQQSEDQGLNGEVRSRRDSISSSVSVGSSLLGTHDDVMQILKEKMRLEGQLESLTSEADQALKEKTELQAQIAALNAQLQAQDEQRVLSEQKHGSLNVEVSSLQQTCSGLEQTVTELQTHLETKNASVIGLSNDLQLAEEQYQRLIGKVEEMRRAVTSRDSTVHDLRLQMTTLQSQLQQAQWDRTALSSQLKASQSEILSLQQVRLWYQQQLALAQEARVRLQGEMATMQAGHMTQASTVEHLKMENVSLFQQLTETQQKSIKEKERIAVHLQNIEVDMLDQEKAFQQIQEAKVMVEDDLTQKLEEFEEEREHLQKLTHSATALERELEAARLNLKQRELQLEALHQEQLDLMKQLTLAQEALHTKKQGLSELQARYDGLEAQLEEAQSDGSAKDELIQSLQQEKIVLEVALHAGQTDQEVQLRGAQSLEEGTALASEMLEQLQQEIAVKTSQVENTSFKKQSQKLKEQLVQQKVMVEAYRRDATSKDQLISELKSTKKRLECEVKECKQELLQLKTEAKSAGNEQTRLHRDLSRVQHDMAEVEAHLELALKDRDELETELQSVKFDRSQLSSLSQENETLRKEVEELQVEAKRGISEQKVRMKKLGTDLTSAQRDMKAKHKAYENAVGILSRRLQEALTSKESAEAELSKLRAQVAEGGNEIVLQLQEARGFRKKIRRLEEANKKLSLELEHERGKLSGLSLSHAALKEHTSILETALAKREADLVQLNLQVQAVLKRKEEEDQQMKRLVHALQSALERERGNVKELKQQVTAKAEAGHNRRHYRAAALELSEVKKELQGKEQLVRALQAEADKLQNQEGKHSQEVAEFQEELAATRTQLQLLQKQLDEELNKQPAANQEVEDLKWEVEQKERELQAIRQQLSLTEQRSQKELEGLQDTLQGIKANLEDLQEELTVTRKDKFLLQTKVTELRNGMKTLLQQNQQLKVDLKQTRTRKRMEIKGDIVSSTPVTPVKIPDCPVPAALLEELLRPQVVSKEPLNNLHTCLKQLRQEMDSLQRQMEEHTVTVHQSMSSWTQIEGQFMELTVDGSALGLEEHPGASRENQFNNNTATPNSNLTGGNSQE
uniref:Golgin A3 n=1 Tax=Callorhinchus milii TaxID=7868 RepID=A0A4W3IPQ5_CALMI